jgi:hypothetical protein
VFRGRGQVTLCRLELSTPEELLAIGFGRSRVVMVNEAHDGMSRCVRTREIGRRLLPAAHAAGVRHFAMEALYGPYPTQPDLRGMIDAAEELGWKLIPYEARGTLDTNAREEQQARNLLGAFAALPPAAPLLVWCGWGHLYKRRHFDFDFRPMASQFWEMSGVEPFSIDQTVTVESPRVPAGPWHALGRGQAWRLRALGGTAGFLVEDSPIPWPWVDAVLLSTEYTLE